MTVSLLAPIAALAGIKSSYRNAWGRQHDVSPEALRAVLAALGVPVDTEESAASGLMALQEQSWRNLVEPVKAVWEDEQPITVALTLPALHGDGDIAWTVCLENGERRDGKCPIAELPVDTTRDVGQQSYARRILTVPDKLPVGYHQVEFVHGADRATTTLIVAPTRCFLPPEYEEGAKIWGLTAQVYALRSDRNWGMGDLTGLGELAELAGKSGAALLGVNPMHALFWAEPRHISPYSPSTRLFLNWLYIDPTAIEEFADCSGAKHAMEQTEFSLALNSARNSEFVEHELVAVVKKPVLEAVYLDFREKHLLPEPGGATTERGRAFREFQEEGAKPLRDFALFEVLHEHFLGLNAGFSWTAWPAPFRDIAIPEVQAFATAHLSRIEFFEFLQFEADRQLGVAVQRGRAAGLTHGLYRDLAVGVDPHGAEAWSDQFVMVNGASVGAPPDILNQKGQNWGLAPINPVALKERAYAPFVAAVRANMRHAGALRIDHVMALNQLFVIPQTVEEGAYLAYPFEDLLRVVALESRRQCCLVIGEDLGTVPEGFRENLQRRGILSYKVMMFEREGDQHYAAPDSYPRLAAASIATHDLPSLKGWWLGTDLDWRRKLDLYPSQELADADAVERARDRRFALEILALRGLLEPSRQAEFLSESSGPVWGADLGVAMHKFIAQTSCFLALVQLEDMICEQEQTNMPGTTDAHPNWRRKLSLPTASAARNGDFVAIAAALAETRARAQGNERA